MPYIGNSPGTGTRNRFIYTATASQTTFSGADDNGKTLKYADSDYVDVYLNGICLVPVTDYTSTSKTSIVLTQAASLNDTLEVVAYDIATISDTVSKADGGTFEADVTFADGADIITASAGTDNVRLGEGAGDSIASGGDNNVAIGKDAGTAISTGDLNVAVGSNALKTISTHSNNTAVGAFALDAGTGASNVAVGSGAMGGSSYAADNNVAVGKDAFNSNTTGSDGVAIGFETLINNTSGGQNTAVGRKAMYTNTTGDNNTSVGFNSMYFNTTGADNAAFGTNALQANTTGNYNTAVGRQAFLSNTTADYGTAIGYQALSSNTTGAANTAVGYECMEAVTTGTRNTGVGMQTGHDLTTGGYNTYLGNFAGEYSTTGSYNTCVGDAAGSSFTTGSSNTFVGQQAGNAISTGSSNTIIGRYTGNSNGLDIRTSSNNIILASGDGVPRLRWTGGGAWQILDYGAESSTDRRFEIFVGSQSDWAQAINHSFSSQYFILFQASGTSIGSIQGNGSNASYGTTSDYRLKENVVTMTGATERLKQLQPKRFNFIGNDALGTVDGFIAHEVSDVVPDAVLGTKDAVDSDGNIIPQGVDLGKLVPLLVKTVQELEARITELEG